MGFKTFYKEHNRKNYLPLVVELAKNLLSQHEDMDIELAIDSAMYEISQKECEEVKREIAGVKLQALDSLAGKVKKS